MDSHERKVASLALLATAVLLYLGGAACDGKVNRVPSRQCYSHKSLGKTIYNHTFTDIDEKDNISFSRYEGKVILVVNVATFWSFTWHYVGLNALYREYKDLVIVGFPCNQFELQEPGNNASEILNGVKHVRPGNGFIPHFQMAKKIDINGDKEHPLYTYLKKYCPSTRDGYAKREFLVYDPLKINDVRWNWEKFLISKRGIPTVRYDASTPPEMIRHDIEQLLSEDD